MKSENAILIKMGGVAASRPRQVASLAREVASVTHPVVLVHGGGAEVSDLSRRLGLEPTFVNGIRMTSEPEMDVVEMILAGTANKRIVRHLQRAGVRAVGICGADGGLVTGIPIGSPDGSPSRTARVGRVDPALVHHLLNGGYVPVIGSPSSDGDHIAVNINADDLAFALGESLRVQALVFLSDVPGVMVDGKVVPTLSAGEAERLIGDGSIHGGMIPKVENALTGVAHGVDRVVIGAYESEGDLASLLSGARGTQIVNDEGGAT